jgi:hypothetical protein
MTDPSFHPSPEDLFAYRDGELSQEQRLLVEAHVSGCRSCRERIDAMSGLEAALRRRPDEVGEEYYAAMTGSVLGKIRSGAVVPEEAPAGRAVAPEAPAVEEPGPQVEAPAGRAPHAPFGGEEPRRHRAPAFPWAPLVSTVAAAAAVCVVVVMLVQQQGMFQRVASAPPAREQVGQRGKGPAEPAPATGTAPAPPAPAPVASREAAPSPAPGAAEEAAPALPAAARELAAEKQAPATPAADAQDQPRAASRPEEKVTASAPAQLKTAARIAPEPTTAAPPAGAAKGEAGTGYDALISRYGLPSLYDPGTASDAALRRAEPALRDFYMAGGAGADSARVRLYLAEAARLRYEAQPDSALHETVAHHYWRAIRIAVRTLGPGSDVERTARARLDSLKPPE